MKAHTPLEQFLVADDEARSKLLKDPQTKAEVKRWMGPEAFAEFEQQRLSDVGHLAAGPKTLVFVPGIMGSTLQSNGVGGVWWLDVARARDKLDQLRLNDGGTGDRDEQADIVPGAVDITYEPFCRAMARSDVFGGCVNFPYDWRKSLRYSVDALSSVILKTYEAYQKPVHLVGHSMGGLVIRNTLMVHGKELWPKLGRIVFIGTPHYGSPSIAGYLKNHLWGWEELAIVGMFLSRETFRSLRGALSLLPAPAGIYPETREGQQHPCANFNLYNADDWKLKLDAAETVNLQSVLDEAAKCHEDLYEWHKDQLLQEHKDRMLMIAGVGQKGLFRIELDKGFWKRTEKITERRACDANYDGDGRVPLASARLEDVQIRYVKGEHGALPNLPAVAQDVISWITERELRLSTTCADAVGGHLSADDTTSPAPHLDGSAVGDRYQVLPQFENPTPEFRAQIEKELDAGGRPRINLVKLL